MPKRKSSHADYSAQDVTPRRSTRQRTSTAAAQDPAPSASKPVAKGTSKPARPKPAAKTKARAPKDEGDGRETKILKADRDGDISDVKKTPAGSKSKDAGAHQKAPAPASGRQYWLLKAEPESRFENGVDVKFSIDDLAAKTEPEPWDGMLCFHSHHRTGYKTPR